MVKAVKLSISLAVVCLLVAFGVSSAQADQITFGPSSQVGTFANMSPTTLSLTLGTTALPGPGCVAGDACLSGPAHAGPTTGTFAISTAAFLTVQNSGPFLGAFNLTGNTSAFNYAGGSSLLDGIVTWSYVKDGSPEPNLVGSMLITAVVGTDLTSSYTAGQLAEVDFTFNNLNNGPVDGLFGVPGKTSGATVSSGEVSTPEPASLALFGTGLLGFAFLLRRKKLFA